MSEVHKITVQIRGALGDDPGQVTFGFYLLDGDLLTMTDGDGKPVRRPNGDFYRHTLAPGEEPRRHAVRLTKEIRSTIRGENTATAGFHRKIAYPKGGLA